MEKIPKILNNVKERISNPLIFSFICSWLVINWEITVSLLWYDSRQINNEGCKSIFAFIQDKLNRNNSLLYPVLFAIGYTFLMPIVKNLIRAFYSWAANWGEKLNLWFSKGGKVAIEKYLSLREDYKERTKILEGVILEESEYLKDNEKIVTEMLEVKKELNNANFEKEKLNETINKMNDISFLNGHWKYKYYIDGRDSAGNAVKIEIETDIFISNGVYYEIENEGRKKKYIITEFNYNHRNSSVLFFKILIDREPEEVYSFSESHYINVLSHNDNNRNFLSGLENGNPVEYRRIEG